MRILLKSKIIIIVIILMTIYSCKNDDSEDELPPKVEKQDIVPERGQLVWDEELWRALQTDTIFWKMCELADPVKLKNETDSLLKELQLDTTALERYVGISKDRMLLSIKYDKILYERYPNYSRLYIDSMLPSLDFLFPVASAKEGMIVKSDYYNQMEDNLLDEVFLNGGDALEQMYIACNTFQKIDYMARLLMTPTMGYSCGYDERNVWEALHYSDMDFLPSSSWGWDEFWYNMIYPSFSTSLDLVYNGIYRSVCGVYSGYEPHRGLSGTLCNASVRLYNSMQRDPLGFFAFQYGDCGGGLGGNDGGDSGGGGGSSGGGGSGSGGSDSGSSEDEEDPCNPSEEEIKISLHVPNRKITLMDSYQLEARITPECLDYDDVKFLIVLPTQSYTLQEHSGNVCNEKAVKPGKFKVVALLIYKGTSIISETKEIEVQYPSYNDITSNATVKAAMEKTWEETKKAASATGRKEKGFWIYLNTSTGQYVCEDIDDGPLVTGCEGTNGEISMPPPKSYRPSYSPVEGGYYAVATFHTHTPLTYCTGERFPVGPSSTDIKWGNGNHMPGIVYDYIGKVQVGYDNVGIFGGHDINAPARLYPFGPERAHTPLF